MNRAVKPTDDTRSSATFAVTATTATGTTTTTTLAATSAAARAPSAYSDATSRRLSNTTKRQAAGKRKRSRSQMTTASVHDNMDACDPFVSHAAASPKRARASLLADSQHLHMQMHHSDEDEDAFRFSVPPPPPAVPVAPELVCRYPNKPCPQERATKKHGELHSYCAYHRFKAQRYQRKLEAKKKKLKEDQDRERRERQQSNSPGSDEAQLLRGLALESRAVPYHHHHSSPQKPLSPAARRQPIRARTRSSPPRPSAAMYTGSRPVDAGRIQGARHGSVPQAGTAPLRTLEPFHHPVSLQEGDLQLLQVFLWDSESPPKPTDPSGANTLRATAAVAPRANPHQATGASSGTYDIRLDGFTFTSESL